jgi:hypothetical protein
LRAFGFFFANLNFRLGGHNNCHISVPTVYVTKKLAISASLLALIEKSFMT